ncbi:MAG: hydantoinase B/oxoprolinase family protein [Aggregatilineales bacterium]
MTITRVDPITTEILRNAFISIAQDMNATLIRSAYSPIIYEGKDCSVALLDNEGNVLGQSLGLPLFLGNLQVCVQLTAELYGWDYFRPGDIFYMNDSYMTGTHLNDATVFAPIYWRDRLVGFSASRAHWLDVGGKDPGGPMDSSDIYQEGMRWPPTRIYENGQPREDIIEVLRRNGRFGFLLVGDLNAQVAAGRTGEQRFRDILDRFGYETVMAARDEIFRQSEQLEREAVSAIPNGSYESEGFIDNDGLGSPPVRVKMMVTVEGDRMTIDLDGSSPQTVGPVNCGFAQTISACRVAFKLLVNPQRPVDGGTFKTLEIRAPEGSIFRAQEPAACQWYFTPLGLLIDLFTKALTPALPEKVAGAHYGDSMVIFLAGVDPRNGAPFLAVEPTPGGWGAYHSGDGQDGLINNVNGAFKDLPVEVYESKFPVMIHQYGFRPDTGGAGRFRGGCGIYREYTLGTDGFLSLWFDRSVTPAWGLLGGGTGVGPNVVVTLPDGRQEHLLKVNRKPIPNGTVVKTHTGGGGGYGSPLERDPWRVREDVIDGYVSLQGAREHYGVVLNDELNVDEAATDALRASMARQS